jgi:PleD family two-component response regulator
MTKDILGRLMLALRSNLPIILCTGYSLDISNDNALTLGVRNFLIKPLVVRSFAANICKLPDHKKNKSTMTKGDEML